MKTLLILICSAGIALAEEPSEQVLARLAALKAKVNELEAKLNLLTLPSSDIPAPCAERRDPHPNTSYNSDFGGSFEYRAPGS